MNADHYPSEAVKIAYVSSRLDSDAAEYVYTRKRPGSTLPFLTHLDIIDHLRNIYEDHDRARTYRREYNNLRQGTTPFVEFYAKFTKYASTLGYDHVNQMHDLINKTNPRLQEVYAVCSKRFTELLPLKNYLQQVDNSFRQLRLQKQQLRESAEREKQVATPLKRRPTFNPTSFNRIIPNYSAQRLTTSIPKVLKEQADITGSYYLCNETGHRARECPTKAKGAVRVNEIDDDKEATAVEEEGLEYESSSEN